MKLDEIIKQTKDAIKTASIRHSTWRNTNSDFKLLSPAQIFQLCLQNTEKM